MIIRKHAILAIGATAVALATAGAAVAAGPPSWAPRHDMDSGAVRAGQRAMMGGGVMVRGAVMQAAATYVGISATDLAAARHDGKSLAQVAQANGKTVAGLEAAMTAAFKGNLDAAVTAKRITDAQAAQILATFKSNLDTMVDRTTTGPARGHGHGMGLGLGPCMS